MIDAVTNRSDSSCNFEKFPRSSPYYKVLYCIRTFDIRDSYSPSDSNPFAFEIPHDNHEGCIVV